MKIDLKRLRYCLSLHCIKLDQFSFQSFCATKWYEPRTCVILSTPIPKEVSCTDGKIYHCRIIDVVMKICDGFSRIFQNSFLAETSHWSHHGPSKLLASGTDLPHRALEPQLVINSNVTVIIYFQLHAIRSAYLLMEWSLFSQNLIVFLINCIFKKPLVLTLLTRWVNS